MAADESDREATYDLMLHGPSYWADQAFQRSGDQAEYDRIMAAEPLKRKAAYNAVFGGEPVSSDVQVETGLSRPVNSGEPVSSDVQIETGLSRPVSSGEPVSTDAVSETHWAEQAFQLRGQQEDFDLVMSVPSEKREEMYSLIKAQSKDTA